MTRVLVARSCWETITAELDRVAPREAVMLPLVALQHAAEPCRPIGLRDIDTIVLAEVRCLPPELQHNTVVHVTALPSSDAWADDVVLELVRKHPRLRAAAYLHSHPFATRRTWPSRGDITGHMLPLLLRNGETGLHASFSFIACTGARGGWHLPCFAMDASERVIELGNAIVADDDAEPVRRARSGRPSRYVIRRWKHQLQRRGLIVRADELFDGWLRMQVPIGDHVMVVLFPNDFPATAPQYHWIDRRTHDARRLELEFSLDATEVVAQAAAAAEAA